MQGTKTCPSTAGATNWPSPAYNPDTKLFYLIAQEGCGVTYRSTTNFRPGQGGSGTAYMESAEDRERWQLYVRAIDAVTGKKVWDFEQVSSFHYGPGSAVDSRRTDFRARAAGHVHGARREDRQGAVELQHRRADHRRRRSTYTVDGHQYVAISAFSNVIAFALPEAK